MKLKLPLLFVCFFILVGCAYFYPKEFTKTALEEKLLTVEREEITFKEIIDKNKGKRTFIQIFTSYCPVSQERLKEVLKLQEKYPTVNYVFLSADHSYYDWKRGLKNVKPKGQFYYIQKKGKGALANFLKLKSIPRFLMISSTGKILTYKSFNISKRIKKQLRE